MNHLRTLSWTLTILGILCIAGSQVLNLGLTWLLAGVFLTWAGIVKIIVVLIWTHVARLGTDQHTPEDAV